MLKKKYNIEIEKEIQKLWKDKQAFKFKGADERKIYSVDTPPLRHKKGFTFWNKK